MEHKIQNLFNKEEVILLNLKNISYQVQIYKKKLEKIFDSYILDDLEEKAQWFSKIFEYYKRDLIPALQESAEMEERHIKILERNPDSKFEALRAEVESHQLLTNQVIKRFEQLHADFYKFTISVKNKSKKK